MGLKEDVVFVAGHSGLVGTAICRHLIDHGVGNVITRSHGQLDLGDQRSVRAFFKENPIDHVVLAAAKVGGIHANSTYPAEFIYENLIIQCNVINEAYLAGIHRLLFLGSSCIYPKRAPQPIREEDLLTGPLEPTNAPYALAKIAGIQLCEAYNRQYKTRYRAVMPTNLYGPNDNYHLEDSHVLPAMIRKFHLAKLAEQGDMAAIKEDEARYGILPEWYKSSLGISATGVLEKSPEVVLWGSGLPRRELMHVEDLASACVFVMELADEAFQQIIPEGGMPFVNVGWGKDATLRELADIVSETVGFKGPVRWDKTRHDGTFQKLLDTSRINGLGWSPKISLREGIQRTYESYLNTQLENP